jgi:hypothetical protein
MITADGYEGDMALSSLIELTTSHHCRITSPFPDLSPKTARTGKDARPAVTRPDRPCLAQSGGSAPTGDTPEAGKGAVKFIDALSSRDGEACTDD